jgi:hypothetical protein
MKLWDAYIRLWEMIKDTSPEIETKPAETDVPILRGSDIDEYGDRGFCIGDSDFCVL